MKIAFYTLGCKVNQYETQVLREEFEKRGHTAVDCDGDFDLIVINSCSVTAESDRKTRQQVNHFKKTNPRCITLLTGCMVQASEKTEEKPQADIVVGNTDLKAVVDLAERFFETKEVQYSIYPHTREEVFNTPLITDFAERTRAYIKIEDGCERYCSYCIIPYARGFVRSKPLEEIKKEALDLSKKGFKEIVLVGINLSAYGKGSDTSLCDAVDAVCQVEGISRVRLGSLEPDHISDEMLSRFKAQDKFCPQFHLSLQSGSDGVLKRMNRHYNSAFYEDLVVRIRKSFPSAAISTDIMVGFPNESDIEFEESLSFAEKIGFAKTHVFAYSRRKGTLADKMEGQITKALKQERSRRMSQIAVKNEEGFAKSLIGTTQGVLFETFEEGASFGYTENYVRVMVKSEADLSGQLLTTEIISSQGTVCKGILK